MVRNGQMHGIARYAVQLVESIAVLDHDFDILILANADSTLIQRSWPRGIRVVTTSAAWISLWEQISLPRFIREYDVSLFHSPSFVAPFMCPCALVMTVHDLNHIMLPQFYTPLHQLYYKTFFRYAIHKSRYVITVSDFSKRELVQKISIPEDKIAVTHNGVSENFREEKDLSFRNYVRELYGLPADFLLSVTNNKPHKNVTRLIQAFLHAELELPLVLVGATNPQFIDIAACHGKKHLLYLLDFVAEKHLATVYSLCRAFVYPSTYEGFGLPPLEALACGAPVVVSCSSSLPEILGDCAHYINPYNYENMAQVLKSVCSELDTVGNRFRDQGVKHARTFSWKKMASHTLEVYDRALAVDSRSIDTALPKALAVSPERSKESLHN